MDRIYHSVVEKPHLYDISYFSYNQAEDPTESIIELHLKLNDELVKLKFVGPRELEIEKGFPYATRGMFIEDVSSHQLDGINVFVGDFESNHGAIQFWAYSVEKL